MSTAPKKATPSVEPTFNGPALESCPAVPANGAEAPAADHTEAQLRARIAMLEAQLAEVASCLETAETRAAEIPALRSRLTSLEEAHRSLEYAHQAATSKLAVIDATRSWRYTAPLRVGGRYVRRRLGR